MKKFLHFTLAALVAATFVACSDDGGESGSTLSKISISNVQGEYDGLIDEVVLIADDLSQTDFPGSRSATRSTTFDGYFTIASAPFSNGSANVQLPANPPSAAMYSVRYYAESLTISDPDAMLLDAWFRTAKDGEHTGYLDFGSYSSTSTGYTEGWAEYMYADRNVSITGQVNYDYEIRNYSVHLKKGWNLVVSKEVYTASTDTYVMTISTSLPTSGFKWHFSGVFH